MKQRIFNAAQDGLLDYLISTEEGREPGIFLERLRDDLTWSAEELDEVELTLRTMIANLAKGHRYDWP